MWRQGSQVSMDVAWVGASLLSSHGRGIRPQDASKKNSRGLSRGVAGNPGPGPWVRAEEQLIGAPRPETYTHTQSALCASCMHMLWARVQDDSCH